MKTKKNTIEGQPETRGRKSTSAYPWETLDCGKTFYWAEPWSEAETKTVNNHMQYYGKKLSRKFSQRKIQEGTQAKIKIWRDA